MNRIALAFRAFFALLFHGAFSNELVRDLRLSSAIREPAQTAPRAAAPAPAPTPAAPTVRTADGALQIIGILQRDSRLVDFLKEDISGYGDDQIGAAVRELHDQCRDALERYIKLEPVIDGVEGTYAKAPSKDASVVKFVGNVPAKPPEGGTLRHKGWRAAKIELPSISARQDSTIVAPAELEIE